MSAQTEPGPLAALRAFLHINARKQAAAVDRAVEEARAERARAEEVLRSRADDPRRPSWETEIGIGGSATRDTP